MNSVSPKERGAFLPPLRGLDIPRTLTHGSRRGLKSFATPGLRRIACAGIALVVLVALAVSASASQTNTSPATYAPAGAEDHHSSLQKFSGIYQVSPGRLIYIQPWPGGEGKLLYTGEDGQMRALSFAAEDVYVAGPGLRLSGPTELKIIFAEDARGQITRLIRRRAGAPDTVANRLEHYQQENVGFYTGAVKLAGTLWAPPGKGPHPALVLIHGTGRTDRNNVLPITHFLVTHGVALLGYDKRGVGDSTGDWRSASLEDLAGDALAAVRFLVSRKDIDPKRIGIFGASQGGWLAPIAAANSKDIGFVITISGPAMSPAELELARLEHELRARGFSAEEASEAVEFLKLGNDVARGKQSWEHYQVALENSRNAKWFRYVSAPLTEDSWLFEHWRRLPLDFDPAPAIARIRVPVLALFGGLDQTVLPSENAEKWRTALREAGNKDYTVQIFPSANHMLLEAKTGDEEEYPMLKRFVPEYQSTLLDWLRKHGIVSR